MVPSRRMLKAFAALLPLGALGVSTLLATSPAKAAAVVPDGDAPTRDVARRLQAIRSAVSEVTANQLASELGEPDIQKAAWLNWGVPGWRNGGWNNWRNGWNNGGWHNWNNGWGNGGWHNWNNGWRNW